VQSGKKSIIPDGEIVAEACFYIAALTMDKATGNQRDIERYINKGLANCMLNSKFYTKFSKLKQQLYQNKTLEKKVENRTYGRIKYFNKFRRFGIIETADVSYSFVIGGFRKWLSPETLFNLEGVAVSFVPIRHPKKEHSMVADDIVFEES
jgi:hypothetical protein